MQIDSKTLLCHYRYDALNRLVESTPSAQADTQHFYLKDRLATEIQGAETRSIMQHEDQLLAQQQRQIGTVETRLLATDQQRSVLNVLAAARRNLLAYTPYGHRHPENGLLSLLGFNGERPDPVTGCYLLGNGYRAFNPALMRFNSPDSWSPFGDGGLNTYGYCVGDPANHEDRSGHVSRFVSGLRSLFSSSRDISAPLSSRSVTGLGSNTGPANLLTSLLPPAYSAIDPVPVLKYAEQAITAAAEILYSGEKLKKLISSTQTLNTFLSNNEKFTRNAQRNFQELFNVNPSDTEFLEEAQRELAGAVAGQTDKVIARTKKLNDRIRGNN